MPRDMENYRKWKREKYQENIEKERKRKLDYAKNNKERINELQKISYQNNKEKRTAKAKVNYAVKVGKIVKPKVCSVCNKGGIIHGHHKDYKKPLDVVWLCPSCHLIEHRGPRQGIYKGW